MSDDGVPPHDGGFARSAARAQRFDQARDDIALADVVFLSIQKSGRTWVRHFLQTYFGHIAGREIAMAPRIMAGTGASPAISFHADFFEIFEHEDAPPAVLFAAELSARPLILLLRDPRDVVVSAYHHTRARKPLDFARHVPSGTIDDYVRSGVYGVERLAAYQALATRFFRAHRMPKLLLTYEALRADPAAEFARLIAFLSSAPIDPTAFTAALDASSVAAMRDLEIRISREGRARTEKRLGVDDWSGDVNELKVRRAVVGGYLDECPALDSDDAFPITRAVLGAPLDAAALSDTHWTVGATPGDAATMQAIETARRLDGQIEILREKAERLRTVIRGRDAIIAKLRRQLEHG